jgi:hypothetical protein
VRIRGVNQWQDAPEWLVKLVRGKWGAPEWRAWEEAWKLRLAKHGVTPDMLTPVGDPGRPTAIQTRPPGGRWCHGPIYWGEDDEGRAVLLALGRLVEDVEAAAGAPTGAA